jgi:ABC-type transport system involved in Fe-S cluster assembly fused permease/ATPase subunit
VRWQDRPQSQALQRELDEHIGGRTVLAIANRLSTIAGFDLIVVMADAR